MMMEFAAKDSDWTVAEELGKKDCFRFDGTKREGIETQISKKGSDSV